MMSDDTKALTAEQERRLRTLASNSIVGADVRALLADRDALAAENAKLREDAERLDAIERCIRDGSYRSILNDIIAFCEHSYANFGSGPALRSAIDGRLAAPKDAP